MAYSANKQHYRQSYDTVHKTKKRDNSLVVSQNHLFSQTDDLIVIQTIINKVNEKY